MYKNASEFGKFKIRLVRHKNQTNVALISSNSSVFPVKRDKI